MVALVGAAPTTPALSARNSAVELQSHMVGQGGVDPPIPKGAGFTVRCSCRFATDPYLNFLTLLFT